MLVVVFFKLFQSYTQVYVERLFMFLFRKTNKQTKKTKTKSNPHTHVISIVLLEQYLEKSYFDNLSETSWHVA